MSSIIDKAIEALDLSVDETSSGVQEYKCAVAQVMALIAIAQELEKANKLKEELLQRECGNI